MMKFLQSKQLAIWLIISLALASMAGVVVPQEIRGIEEYAAWAHQYAAFVPIVELLGLNRVFQTKWFLALGLIFFVNLASCTLGQIQRAWKLRKVSKEEADSVPKGYWALWGNCVFHIGLLVVVVGSLLTVAYKMAGYVEIAEGETFTESHGSYLAISEGPLFNEQHQSFKVMVQQVNTIFKSDGQVEYVKVRLLVTDGSQEPFPAEAERGQPFDHRGITFYYDKSGFAPFISIKDPQGQIVLEGYALFNSLWHNNNGEFTMDLALPGTNFLLKARFYPDAVAKDGKITTESIQLTNPLIEAVVMDKQQPVGKIEFKPGQAALFQGWSVRMGDDIRLWAGFEVVRDPGAPVIFSGFIICVAGLIMSFTFTSRKPRKEQEDEG